MTSKWWRVLREPSVFCWSLPAGSNLVSSPGACQIFTRFQSASSSSARIIGMPVRTPCPISERLHVSVTVPSSAISTKRLGLTEVPLLWPRAVPIMDPAETLAPSTTAPVTPADFRKVRRLMFCTPSMIRPPPPLCGPPRRSAGRCRSDRCCRPCRRRSPRRWGRGSR